MTIALNIAKNFVNIVPDSVHGKTSATVCNLLLKGQKFRQRLSDLEGKRLKITIDDTNSCLHLYFSKNRLNYDTSRKSSDIHIRGNLSQLMQLALGDEDPDTLFFSRQLDIEGNTEDALLLKNFLHSLEFDSHAHMQDCLGESIANRLHPVIQKLQPAKHIHKIIKRLSTEETY